MAKHLYVYNVKIKHVAESGQQQIKLKVKVLNIDKKFEKKLLTNVKSSDILNKSLEGDKIVTAKSCEKNGL